MTSNRYCIICLLMVVSLMIHSGVFASSWRVMPIRLDFDQRLRSGSVTIMNEGDSAVNLQVSAMEWVQDSQGSDIYVESKDLIYFPKVLSIQAGESKILRAGLNVPATTHEKSYRLFVEELPEPQKNQGAAVSIAVRFGVPIFAAPVKAEVKGDVSKIVLNSSSVDFVIHNMGNSHFRIHALNLIGRDETGAEVFHEKKDGWYLLAKAERAYSIPFPKGGCGKATEIELLVNTDKGDFSAREKLPAGLCRP